MLVRVLPEVRGPRGVKGVKFQVSHLRSVWEAVFHGGGAVQQGEGEDR